MIWVALSLFSFCGPEFRGAVAVPFKNKSAFNSLTNPKLSPTEIYVSRWVTQIDYSWGPWMYILAAKVDPTSGPHGLIWIINSKLTK